MLVIDIRLVAYIIAETIELDRQESNYYKVQFVSNNPILGVKKIKKPKKGQDSKAMIKQPTD